MMSYGGLGLGFAFLGPILMLLFWGGIIALIVWAVQTMIPRRDSRTISKPSALEILQERYVRGEISREEFEMMKKELL